MLLLLDPHNDKHYLGATLAEVLAATGAVMLSFSERRVFVKGERDTVSFAQDYTDEELVREANRRALSVLCRHHGWTLFKSEE